MPAADEGGGATGFFLAAAALGVLALILFRARLERWAHGFFRIRGDERRRPGAGTVFHFGQRSFTVEHLGERRRHARRRDDRQHRD